MNHLEPLPSVAYEQLLGATPFGLINATITGLRTDAVSCRDRSETPLLGFHAISSIYRLRTAPCLTEMKCDGGGCYVLAFSRRQLLTVIRFRYPIKMTLVGNRLRISLVL